jgi:hypothetical protein
VGKFFLDNQQKLIDSTVASNTEVTSVLRSIKPCSGSAILSNASSGFSVCPVRRWKSAQSVLFQRPGRPQLQPVSPKCCSAPLLSDSAPSRGHAYARPHETRGPGLSAGRPPTHDRAL